MWRIKKLFDPRGLLAPGGMLNKDPLGHVENTHTLLEIEHVANAASNAGTANQYAQAAISPQRRGKESHCAER
jgi:hypothetical protein